MTVAVLVTLECSVANFNHTAVLECSMAKFNHMTVLVTMAQFNYKHDCGCPNYSGMFSACANYYRKNASNSIPKWGLAVVCPPCLEFLIN